MTNQLCNVETIQWSDIVNVGNISIDPTPSKNKNCKYTTRQRDNLLRVKRFLIWYFATFLFQQVENVTQAVSMAHVGHLVLKTVRLVSTVLLIVSLFTANKSKVKQICAHNPPIFHL